MMEKLLEQIRDAGGRLTKTKKAIVEVLVEDCCLVSKSELVERLRVRNIRPDRSTVYRELLFLTKVGVVAKKTIAGRDHFELTQDRHHHLVCFECRSICRVEIDDRLKSEERRIAEENQFELPDQAREFYGYCDKCRN